MCEFLLEKLMTTMKVKSDNVEEIERHKKSKHRSRNSTRKEKTDLKPKKSAQKRKEISSHKLNHIFAFVSRYVRCKHQLGQSINDCLNAIKNMVWNFKHLFLDSMLNFYRQY